MGRRTRRLIGDMAAGALMGHIAKDAWDRRKGKDGKKDEKKSEAPANPETWGGEVRTPLPASTPTLMEAPRVAMPAATAVDRSPHMMGKTTVPDVPTPVGEMPATLGGGGPTWDRRAAAAPQPRMSFERVDAVDPRRAVYPSRLAQGLGAEVPPVFGPGNPTRISGMPGGPAPVQSPLERVRRRMQGDVNDAIAQGYADGGKVGKGSRPSFPKKGK